MSRLMHAVVLAVGFVGLTAITAMAQATTSETKAFEVLVVDGNQLIVRVPEGTRELTVPNDFRFTVDGQQLSVQQLKPGMKGTATITTKTTLVPVTVTEVKSGTVAVRSSAGIIVRTPEGVKSFTQGDVDKRGVKIFRDGKPVQVSQLREGDQLSATIVTSLPPRVVTEQEVNATLAKATAAGGGGGGGSAAASRSASSAPSASAGAAPQASAGGASTSGGASGGARTLPKTASSWPLLWLASILSLAIGLALTLRRRLVS